jgi:hypothetical protein
MFEQYEIDRTSAQPQVSLSFLRNNSLKFQPQVLHTKLDVLRFLKIKQTFLLWCGTLEWKKHTKQVVLT